MNDPGTGLVYMQQRYYDPEVGRFLSVDPVGPSVGQFFAFNRYDYTNNNPINHTDPDGRCVDGLTCGTMLEEHVAWRMSHPGAPPDALEKSAMAGVGAMAVPTVGVAGVAALRSPSLYLGWSLVIQQGGRGVVRSLQALAERQRIAKIVEAEASVKKLIEELLRDAQKKPSLPPPLPPELPPPPQLPTTPPKSPAPVPIMRPHNGSSDNGRPL